MFSNRTSMNEPPPSYESTQIERRSSDRNASSRSGPSPLLTASASKAPSLLPLLTIPTKKYPLSSGFPYDSSIFRLGVSPDMWAQFSDEIGQATKLSITQQSLAWTSGIGVGLVSVAAVPPFGAAAGVFAGKAVYDKSILSKVKQGLGGGKLGEVLNRWNDQCWREKGVIVRLDVKQGKQLSSPENEDRDVQKKKDKRKGQRQGYGRFELIFESATGIPSPTGSNSAELASRSLPEAAPTRTNTVPVEIEHTTFAEIQTTVHHPPLANEKATLASQARASWTSAHPSESPRSPLSDTNDIVPEDDDESLSPASDIARSPEPSPRRGLQDGEIPPIEESAERRPYNHSHNFTQASLAPAPLFAG